MKDKIKAILAVFIIAVIIWFGLDAFIGLVANIYHFLDGFIWAFFAGIIAFFIALWLVVIMIYITMFVAAGVIVAIATVLQTFKR